MNELQRMIEACSPALQEEIQAKLDAQDEDEPKSLSCAVRDTADLFEGWAHQSLKASGLTAKEREEARKIEKEIVMLLLATGCYQPVDNECDLTVKEQRYTVRVGGQRYEFRSWEPLRDAAGEKDQ